MKLFFHRIRNVKNLNFIGVALHALTAFLVVVPFPLTMLMCLGSEPGDACGDFIIVVAVLASPLIGVSFIISNFVSLLTMRKILLLLFVLSIGTFVSAVLIFFNTMPQYYHILDNMSYFGYIIYSSLCFILLIFYSIRYFIRRKIP